MLRNNILKAATWKMNFLRRIYCPKMENRELKIRNQMLYELCSSIQIIGVVKCSKIRWFDMLSGRLKERY